MSSTIHTELHELGMKQTPQRLEIMRAIKENMHKHPSLKELHGIVRKKIPTLSFSTLFNTIMTLDRAGYLTVFDLEGETRIELNLKSHINIIDRKKKRITDIDDGAKVQRVLKELGGNELKGKNIIINVIIY